MRADLAFTRAELNWRAKHGVTTTERRTLNRAARRLLYRAGVRGAMPPGPHGFDVSSYQPPAPDFRAGGRMFAIFKCTEGTGYFDPHFNANRSKAHGQALEGIGLYHFARPGSHSADAEAAWFLAHAGAPGPNEFAVLDYEVPPWSEAWIVRFIQVLAAHGWRCAFYSYGGMIGANPTGQIVQATPWVWIAAYSSSPPGSDRWPHWTLWQHTDGGVDGPWDCSVAFTPLFAQLAGPAQPPPAPPPAPTQEEPVGAFALPALGPGETYTFRPPPAEHSGGIAFGAVFVSFGADFGANDMPAASVPLRVAFWDRRGPGWNVPFGGGHYTPDGGWVDDNPAVPPLLVPTNGEVVAIQWHDYMTKCSIVNCGKAGRVVPLVEYQAG